MPGHCLWCINQEGVSTSQSSSPSTGDTPVGTQAQLSLGFPSVKLLSDAFWTRLWVQRQRPLAFLGSFSPSPSLRECLSM